MYGILLFFNIHKFQHMISSTCMYMYMMLSLRSTFNFGNLIDNANVNIKQCKNVSVFSHIRKNLDVEVYFDIKFDMIRPIWNVRARFPICLLCSQQFVIIYILLYSVHVTLIHVQDVPVIGNLNGKVLENIYYCHTMVEKWPRLQK